MGIIKAAKLAFDYLRYEEEGEEPEVNRAIDHVDLDIEEGKFIAILGHNGSGKSTLAKHINGLLVPTEGTLWVDHMNTASDADIWNIRQKAGMVFQNPDNQIIGTVVEEDVGFGPENLGVPPSRSTSPETVTSTPQIFSLNLVFSIAQIPFPAPILRRLYSVLHYIPKALPCQKKRAKRAFRRFSAKSVRILHKCTCNTLFSPI